MFSEPCKSVLGVSQGLRTRGKVSTTKCHLQPQMLSRKYRKSEGFREQETQSNKNTTNTIGLICNIKMVAFLCCTVETERGLELTRRKGSWEAVCDSLLRLKIMIGQTSFPTIPIISF